MIHDVHGDILLTKAQAIAHGVSPGDHFTNGLALALREKYPVMVKDFRHYAHQCHPKPGEIWQMGRGRWCPYFLPDDAGRRDGSRRAARPGQRGDS